MHKIERLINLEQVESFPTKLEPASQLDESGNNSRRKIYLAANGVEINVRTIQKGA
jgi:hypothetical protein